MSECKPVATPIPSHYKLCAVKGELSKDDENCMKGVPYSNALGSLMYAMVGTRPDIAYGVSLVRRFISKCSREHWKAVKWLLRYIKGSVGVGLCYEANKEGGNSIRGYCDFDYTADLDRRRSLTGYVFIVGGNVVSRKSNLQHIVTLSTTEAKYVALVEPIKEVV